MIVMDVGDRLNRLTGPECFQARDQSNQQGLCQPSPEFRAIDAGPSVGECGDQLPRFEPAVVQVFDDAVDRADVEGGIARSSVVPLRQEIGQKPAGHLGILQVAQMVLYLDHIDDQRRRARASTSSKNSRA